MTILNIQNIYYKNIVFFKFYLLYIYSSNARALVSFSIKYEYFYRKF